MSADLKWLVTNSSSILSKIKKLENMNTQRNLLAAALVGLDLANQGAKREPFIKHITVLNKAKEELARSGDRTPKQQEKFIAWKEILRLRRLLDRTVRVGHYYRRKALKREFNVMQQALVLHLYTQMPPVRNDWSTVKFLTETEWEAEPKASKQSNNFLVMARGGYRIYWADYKTVKKHGVLMDVIPQPLTTVLRRHIKYLRQQFPDNNHLLLNANGAPMTRNGLTKFMQRMFMRHFNKKISTSALRSIFLSHKFDKSQLEEQRTIAKQMHHTTDVARDFYVKKT